MKAIQTRYKGYHFRSRLEARWAVFFDALGLEWEYEPEGFELSGGIRYLPDFRVTGTDTNGDKMLYWFEVKPENHECTAKEAKKISAFIGAGGGACGYAGGFFVVDGLPKVTKSYASLHDDGPSWSHILWSHRRRPWHGTFEDEPAGEIIASISGIKYHDGKHGDWLADYWAACNAARSARFEHGETPRIAS